MARKFPLASLEQISEINLTPLMDLTFILLITFIITFPLIEQGIPVNLPTGKAKELKADKAWSITLDKQGLLFVNGTQVDAERLKVQMKELGESDPDVRVMIRADEDIAYREVVKVLKILSDAKISRMALVTRTGDAT